MALPKTYWRGVGFFYTAINALLWPAVPTFRFSFPSDHVCSAIVPLSRLRDPVQIAWLRMAAERGRPGVVHEIVLRFRPGGGQPPRQQVKRRTRRTQYCSNQLQQCPINRQLGDRVHLLVIYVIFWLIHTHTLMGCDPKLSSCDSIGFVRPVSLKKKKIRLS